MLESEILDLRVLVHETFGPLSGEISYGRSFGRVEGPGPARAQSPDPLALAGRRVRAGVYTLSPNFCLPFFVAGMRRRLDASGLCRSIYAYCCESIYLFSLKQVLCGRESGMHI